ncbi:MAG: DUF1080 domain-containing protein [Acidobacteriia bacterium]|nr:DUF1080 domain-containing protein [Terriglobia bacterium]
MHILFFTIWLALTGSLSAQVTLFDGATLQGWSVEQGPQSAFYVEERAIAGSPSAGFPAWLRSDKEYENFELELEFFVKGWTDGGIYLHAPLHGHRSRSGFKISLFHQQDKEPRTNSMGSIFPLVAPRLVNVRNQGEWNQLRIRMDWPQLSVWSNGEIIHNLNVETVPELRYRLRRGYLGLETLSYPLRFRNLRIRELPSKEKWEALYEQPRDLEKWTLTEPNAKAPAKFAPLGAVLRADGLGNLTTKTKYRDFEMRMYIRGSRHHNGGVLFRSQGGRGRYEIQLHDVEESHYPTGSLYSLERARYPRIEPEQWFLFQLIVQGARCLVRINGETVMEYDKLENLEPGWIELQAHDAGRPIEYKQILVKPQ